jgi:capsular exopolysaccharide synthesis family protein
VLKEPGFTDLVVDEKGGFEDCVKPTSVENLRVLPCGTVPPNPAELLGSPRAAQVMEQLKEHADVVVYDSPPAATVTDAVVMASRVDAVLQVVQAGGTRRDLVRQGRAVLEKVGARILGPVLNRVSLSDLGYYSYYYYYGYYYRDRHEREPDERSGLRRLLPWRRRRRRPRTEKIAEEQDSQGATDPGS